MDDSTLSMGSGPVHPEGDGPSSWGPFRLIEKVGEGAFGQVYRAWDPTLEREVALKLLRHREHGDQAEKTVLREARLLARVRHPNVVPVYGVDRHDGRVGFWSDFVRGKTLSAVLRAQGPFGHREAALIGIEICKAVGAVHAAGLLHRDIKTANVMREEGGRILLMDFGLSHDRSEDREFAGTPVYMAPELLAGAPATAAADIYALGVLLYHLMTGKYPVDGANVRELRAAHESGSQRGLFDERPDLPEQFVRVVENAIDRDPKKRYATAGQMINALTEAIGMGTAAGEAIYAPVTRGRTSWIWFAAAILVIAALAVWFTPLRTILLPGSAAGATASARADYLKAQDLLDHYYKPHSLDDAIDRFKKTLEEDPRFALAHAGLGRAYFQKYRDTGNAGLSTLAETSSSQALSLDRNLPSPHVTLGMLYTQSGRNDLASQELDEAIRLDSRNSEAYGALGELRVKQGRAAEVEPAFRKAADLAPSDWRWPNLLGYFYLTNGKLDAAVEQFKLALQLTPDNPRPSNNLGIAYLRRNQLPDAEAAFAKTSELEPTFSHFSNLGAVLQQEGKYAEAAPMYQKAIDLNPSSYLAWANLASAYDRTPENHAKARDTYLKAISAAEETRKQRPKDARVLADLGAYYAAVGMPAASLPLLRQSAALAPDDPQIRYRLGEAYELLHQRDDALAWIGKALAAGYSLETIERNPDLEKLRQDRRFPALRRKVQ